MLPIVIAKGEDYLAAKIKEIARDHQIEIVENKPLARMLYANVDVGQAVPPELVPGGGGSPGVCISSAGESIKKNHKY